LVSAKPKLVETANALSANDFYDKYAPPNLTLMLFEGLKPPTRLISRYGDATTLLSAGDSLLKECLRLIELTSAPDYENSEMKWSTSKKWKEMKLPDLRYIILVTPDDAVAGFISFMVTYEDGHEIVYIYEIHLIPEWQSQGLGQNMMHVVEAFAQNVAVSKVMLTVFRTNRRAVDWYTKQGYQEDEYSPGPRKLRNGTVKQPSYIILSKQMNR
jgi:ribosomal protein S18 acetylase RimI-like enzyme